MISIYFSIFFQFHLYSQNLKSFDEVNGKLFFKRIVHNTEEKQNHLHMNYMMITNK